MTLEQLRIFVAVAEHEHMTRAAHHLNLTQSATSAAIAALENRYVTKLFDRVGRRIALTEAGRLFLVEAKAVLTRAATAETVLADLAGLSRGTVRIAASQTVGNYWLPPIIRRFRSIHGGVTLKLSLGNTETVAAAVREGLAELGFIEGDIDDPVLAVRSIARDQMVLVAPNGHPWSQTPPKAADDLRTAQWVCRERGSGTRAALEAVLPALGLGQEAMESALELPSNEAVCAAVEAGAGVTILSSHVVRRALEAGSLVAIDIKLPSRSFFVLRHKERYVTKASAEFQRLAIEKPIHNTADPRR
ncbi:LysR family transcriptional regulator [Leptospira interrogans]